MSNAYKVPVYLLTVSPFLEPSRDTFADPGNIMASLPNELLQNSSECGCPFEKYESL
jgi:hypothetical protein